MPDNMDGKLTAEEEALLREFEAERSKMKAQMEAEVEQEVKKELADEVMQVMIKEAEGGLTAEVKKAVDEEVEAKVKQEADMAAIGEKSMVVDTEAVRRQLEQELRGRIEAETRQKVEEELRKKIEEEARRKIEEQRAELEAKIRKEMEDKERAKKEEVLKKLQVLKQMEDDKKKTQEDEMRKKLENEMAAKEAARKEEILKKLQVIEKIESEAKKLQEEDLKSKMREEIKLEMEEERKRKKQEILNKLDSVRAQSSALQQKLTEVTLNYNEQTGMINLFEESQKIFLSFLAPKMDKKTATAMFARSVQAAEKKMPDVLRRANTDKNGAVKTDGTLEGARLLANINSMEIPEPEKAKKFLAGLREIFEERLIGAETATSFDTRELVFSQFMGGMEKLAARSAFPKKLTDIFMTHVIPNTTMKQAD